MRVEEDGHKRMSQSPVIRLRKERKKVSLKSYWCKVNSNLQILTQINPIQEPVWGEGEEKSIAVKGDTLCSSH